MNPGRVGAVIIKEGLEVLRDPITLGVALLMPLVMLFLFGYAIRLDVRDVPMSVADADQSASSRRLVRDFLASGYFTLHGNYTDPGGVESDLQSGRSRLGLIVPAGFDDHLARGGDAPVQVIVDGTYSATSTLVAGYAEAVIRGFGAREVVVPVSLETRVWFNPSLRSVNDVVPGLYAVILLAFPPLLTALAVVREKETGSIQQIFASPVTPAEFIAGKLLPYAMIAFVEMVMVIVAGYAWFGVPFRGSVGFLLGVSWLYVLCTVGIGLLVSTVTRTQLVAMLVALIVTLMPSFLFSGMLFPIFTMPYVLQLYTAVFPGRYFVDVSRGVVLKDASLESLWPNVAILVVYTLAVFVLAAWRLRKKVA